LQNEILNFTHTIVCRKINVKKSEHNMIKYREITNDKIVV